jgi:hypothetical protein
MACALNMVMYLEHGHVEGVLTSSHSRTFFLSVNHPLAFSHSCPLVLLFFVSFCRILVLSRCQISDSQILDGLLDSCRSAALSFCRRVLSARSVGAFCRRVLSARSVGAFCRRVLSECSVGAFCLILIFPSFCRIVVLSECSVRVFCRSILSRHSVRFSFSRPLVLLDSRCSVAVSSSQQNRKHLNPVLTILVIPRCCSLENPRCCPLH